MKRAVTDPVLEQAEAGAPTGAPPDAGALFAAGFAEHAELLERTRGGLDRAFGQLVARCRACLKQGGKLLFFGNGGSAADAQHLAAELCVRYERERAALPALALTTDSSTLTAAGNDLGFERIFARQIEALGRAGDVAIGISTSGRSANVACALRQARSLGLVTAALTGRDGGELPGLADVCLIVPSGVTARIQEMHILLGHLLCSALEADPGAGVA
jgi:D-sedoheptulose 7-phosphate isomerase